MGALSNFNMSLSQLCHPDGISKDRQDLIMKESKLFAAPNPVGQDVVMKKASRMQQDIDQAISLLENNPSVSAQVVQALRNICGKQQIAHKLKESKLITSEPPHDHPRSHLASNTLPFTDTFSGDGSGESSSDRSRRQHLKEEQVIEIYLLRPKSS